MGGAISSTRAVTIGDGSAWTFINGAWHDGPDAALVLPDELVREDGPAIQGHHYAFSPLRMGDDLRARFQVRLSSHADAGIILRAHDPTRFWLLHFPECGQANRAQHFWAALSRMDESGYVRIAKMDMVRRVASTNNLWHDVDLRVAGTTVRVEIDGRGVFEASDPAFRGPGRVGFYRFGRAEIRGATLEGTVADTGPWDDRPRPARTWFHPCPDTDYGRWQRPAQLVRAANGDVILNYTVQERPYDGSSTPLIARSTDGGRTWSKPQLVAGLKTGEWDDWGIVHCFPDGVVRLLVPGPDSLRIAASPDHGRTFLPPEPATIAPAPAGLSRIHPGPLVNLADGSVLMFGYGGHTSTIPGAPIQMWGSHHCQAFAARSTDGGRTWSPWVSIDGTEGNPGEHAGGNLDLTEVCGAQVADGRIVALARPIYSPWMWETWSGDGGATWTPCMRGPFPGYATSNMLHTAAGAILVAHRLPGCTIHASRDDGRTWDAGTMIDSAIWVMGGMVELEPDVVLYVYWDSFESLMRAQLIRVTPSGLEPVSREG